MKRDQRVWCGGWELISLSMLIETASDGIPLDETGTCMSCACTTMDKRPLRFPRWKGCFDVELLAHYVKFISDAV